MARDIQLTKFSVVVEGTGSVVHVSQVIFSLIVVLMVPCELSLVRKLEKNGKELQ